jgi:hypothetical protein
LQKSIQINNYNQIEKLKLNENKMNKMKILK